MYVFVYGTLKRGQPNHSFMFDSEFIGHAITKQPNFDLFSVGDYYPGATDGNFQIIGEVYNVDAESLGRLDELENEGNLYTRQSFPIILDSGEIVNAWMYLHLYPQEGGGKSYESSRICREESVVEWLQKK